MVYKGFLLVNTHARWPQTQQQTKATRNDKPHKNDNIIVGQRGLSWITVDSNSVWIISGYCGLSSFDMG